MRVDDQTKVTNVIAAAIEYIEKSSQSSLAAMVRPALVKELRGAIAIVAVAARREIETLPTPELKNVAAYALETLALRENAGLPDEGPYPERVDQFVRFARELVHVSGRFGLRISTATLGDEDRDA